MDKMKEIRKADMICPLDYRYYIEDEELYEKIKPYLSEEAYIKYLLRVEITLIKAMAKFGICPSHIISKVKEAASKIKIEEVYEEEKKIEHDLRALVRILKKRAGKEAEPYIHLFATSADIVDTANSLRYKELTKNVIIPELVSLERKLIKLARDEKSTIQIGRTHGKHAIPITFGFYMANYVDRIGKRIEFIKKASDNLIGQISGAVGAYNAFNLVAEEYAVSPNKFEKEVLNELGLKSAKCSFQIIQPEPMLDFIYSIISCFSILANFSDDMRNLMRSEIGEIDVKKEEKVKRVGSSTMPHKVNPWHFEHIKSMWKAFMPRIVTHMMDQISEHQRDLTNSASSRFIPELLAAFIHCIIKLRRTLEKTEVSRKNMRKNFETSKKEIIAEPLYVILAVNGFPNAYEYIKELILRAREEEKSLIELFWKDEKIQEFLKDKLTERQKEVLNNPEKYIGIAEEKAEEICNYWEERIKQNL